MIIIGVTIAAAAAVVVGIILGSLGNQPVRDPGDNRRTDDCKQACGQWLLRKTELCDAERAEEDARERVEIISDLLKAVAAGTVAVVAALVGTALVNLSLAELGLPGVVAAALLAAAIAVGFLGAAVSTALGAALVTALVILAEKQGAAQRADLAETEARSILISSCPPDQVAACLESGAC